MLKIGFVTPWYGETIGGGAEAELRGLVHHLMDAGMELEVLTTCVKSFSSDWSVNDHAPGFTREAGIPVRRFPVRRRDTKAFDAVNFKLMNSQTITEEEEEIYCREMINSPELYDYIRKEGVQYRAFVFIPYMFGTTYNGCQIHPEKSILIPCLHDESYAYLKCFRKAFSQTAGMILHSEPERTLAQGCYGAEGCSFVTLGEGVDTDWHSDPQRFRNKYGIKDPFILYAGRKDAGKRVDTLIRWFMHYQQRSPDSMKLILIGGGKIDIPDQSKILDLGYVDVQDKYDAYGAAMLFCNPSEMESFSLVLMESWLAETPALVNGKCAVTRDFVHQANAGLYYENYGEFEQCIRYLSTHEDTASAMGRNGRKYVLTHFDWKVITEKYLRYFQQLGV